MEIQHCAKKIKYVLSQFHVSLMLDVQASPYLECMGYVGFQKVQDNIMMWHVSDGGPD